MKRNFIEFENKKGERILIELTRIEHDRNDKHSLMNLWLKHGFLKEFKETTINLQTYVYDKDGQCWGWYNPTVKMSEDQKRQVLNFDYVMEDTPENREFLIAKVKELAEAGEEK